ncbi:MAG: hypothetical protein ACOC83_02825 [Gemmatimonadota bacterium]
MISRDDIESYLIRTELDFEELEEGIWMVRPTTEEEVAPEHSVVVSYSPPLVLLRAGIRESPSSEASQVRLFRRLLELNANDLVHGSYGLEDGEVVLSDTLELENLDFSEFRASLESLSLALTSHLQELTED